jgi:hypothetical protein
MAILTDTAWIFKREVVDAVRRLGQFRFIPKSSLKVGIPANFNL